jgi:hypothetical protein
MPDSALSDAGRACGASGSVVSWRDEKGEETMSIPWPRFLITVFVVAILTFVFDLFLHGTAIPALFDNYPPADYPSRPAAELQALFPFLIATYLVQIAMFCFLYLRLYPGRGFAAAARWGLWGGFFVVIPNMQFFVAVAHATWTQLILQVIAGLILMVVLMVAFEFAYRPKPATT